uniref:G-protein coupled receptors family 1 profile domain-containing protein n=1 Tax=Ciona savignyi TaxID=51511 RepID=H2ZB98_CIOSA
MFAFKKKNLKQQLNGLAEHSTGYRKLNGRRNRKLWFYFFGLIVLIHLFAIPVHASDTTQSFTPTPNLTSNKFTDLRHSGITIPEYENQGLNSPSKAGLYFILSCVCIFTVIGNVMVILTATIFRKLRTIPNMFIISLASADLTIGTVVLPMWSHYVIGGKWDLGAFWCDIWTSVDVLSVTASIGTLCAISLDRFVAITMPFKYSTKMTRLRARFIIGFHMDCFSRYR